MSAVAVLRALQRVHAAENAARGAQASAAQQQEHTPSTNRANGKRRAALPEETKNRSHSTRGHAGSGITIITRLLPVES